MVVTVVVMSGGGGGGVVEQLRSGEAVFMCSIYKGGGNRVVYSSKDTILSLVTERHEIIHFTHISYLQLSLSQVEHQGATICMNNDTANIKSNTSQYN